MSWITVYNASDMLDAHLVKGLLERQGIQCTLKGLPLLGAMGELPTNVMEIPVQVMAEHQYSALEIIEQRSQIVVTDYWYCQHCGEPNPMSFETCWQCAMERPGD